jgi:hypothetical protein
MPAPTTIFQALAFSFAVRNSHHSHIHIPIITPQPNKQPQTLTSAQLATATPSPISQDVCAISQFLWDVNGAQVCCPGVVDMPSGDRSKAYCCVGASLPHNAVVTTTQTSCATMVNLDPRTEYSSKVREAATRYGVTYTTDVGVGNFTVVSTATVGEAGTETEAAGGSGSSEVSTGGAAARVTAGAVVLVAGGLLFGV